jgi:hypothetical protein
LENFERGESAGTIQGWSLRYRSALEHFVMVTDEDVCEGVRSGVVSDVAIMGGVREYERGGKILAVVVGGEGSGRGEEKA